MGKLFGTDGIRGIAGQTLTAELAFHVGQAVAAVLTEKKGSRPLVTIGKDTRISSDMLEAALMAGICSVGGDVMPLGTIPTPAVAFLTVQQRADAGIVISASHNPYAYNGIKVFNEKGYKLPDATEAKIEEKILSGETIPVATRGEIGVLHHGLKQSKLEYIHHLTTTIDSDLSGLRVLVDCANGAASATAPDLFCRLPLHADFIFDKPDGVNINNGCGSTHMETLCQGVVEGKYELGIAFDGDADRCLLVDEKGNIIDGDKVLAVCGRAMRHKGSLNGDAIVATVMSNLGLHEFCRKGDYNLVCTDVGDRHVLEKMIECGYMIGGEQSGHTIFREFATTGDGELTALQFIQAYCEAGVPASELVACCAQYPQELINVPVSAVGGAKQRIMDDERLWEQVRRQEEALQGEGRILVRPSGTEALIRVMVEAKTVETAHNVAQTLADFIKTL